MSQKWVLPEETDDELSVLEHFPQESAGEGENKAAAQVEAHPRGRQVAQDTMGCVGEAVRVEEVLGGAAGEMFLVNERANLWLYYYHFTYHYYNYCYNYYYYYY